MGERISVRPNQDDNIELLGGIVGMRLLSSRFVVSH